MEQLINFIIRPPRAEYNPKNDLLDQEFKLKGKLYHRKDLEVMNSRKDVLQCSHYMPVVRPEGKPLPCVIYCHGNSGCRADASEAAIILLPSNITVFTLDFSGSGLSGGEHVTLGWNEKDDLKAVVDFLRADGNVSLIGLWGRSMGAVTSLMYGAEDPSIAGMVLDSPFSDLVDLMMELVDTYRIRLPKFTVKFAIQYMRRAIMKKAKFDIMELNTIKVAKSCFVPVLLGHASDDDFIQPHHSDRIFDAYVGDKNIIKFEGDHNSPRPQFYFDSISIFFNNVLQPPEDEVGNAYFDMTHDYFGRDSWSTLDEVGFSSEYLATPSGPTASTEDAIQQLRSRRPMSRTEVPHDISSEDKDSEGQEGTVSDHTPSSSKMISIELSNGTPYRPYVPALVDDDEYVEYPLDSVADFPSNVEEEERMFREAIMESLKDLEVTCPHVEEPALGNSSNPSGQMQVVKLEDLSHTTAQLPSHTESSNLQPNGQHTISEALYPDTVELLLGSPPNASESSNQTEIDGSILRNDTSRASQSSLDDCMANPNPTKTTTAEVEKLESKHINLSSPDTNILTSTKEAVTVVNNMDQSPSDADMADRTKATVTVVKSPTSNVMDGLFRRWDLNFFRNK